MIQERQPDTDFEGRLLAELQAVVAERGAAEATPGGAPSSTGTPAWRRSGPRLALAGTGATAVVVAGALLVSSGPSAEPAVAKVLQHTAAIAAADGDTATMPGPGQFLFTKMKQTELQEWAPGVGGGTWGVLGGMNSPPSPEDSFRALNSWQEETWWSPSPDGPSRNRYSEWSPRFLSEADESDWLAAGSPPPDLFAGKAGGYFDYPGPTVLEQRLGLTDVELDESPSYPRFSTLPTEPRALRLTIERDPVYGPTVEESGSAKMPTAQVISELWDILNKPTTTPALRAAIFGALAELPGIELNRDARDAAGRPGYGLGYETSSLSESYGASTMPGIRVEYIFDPETSDVLGRRETITQPEEISWAKGVPAGTVLRAVAYLQTRVVDSIRERPAEGDGGPTATISGAAGS